MSGMDLKCGQCGAEWTIMLGSPWLIYKKGPICSNCFDDLSGGPGAPGYMELLKKGFSEKGIE
jgi:hypothetical protein